MNELVVVSGSILGFGAVSFGLAYGLRLLVDKFKKVESPPSGAILRIKSGQAMYRTRFLESVADGWSIAAPLQRDTYVPMRPGDEVIGEWAEPNGIARFSSHVASRSAEDHSIVIRLPKRVWRYDRRSQPRILDAGPVKVHGTNGDLIDISIGGAKVSMGPAVRIGQHVRVDLPWMSEPRYGVVLARDGGATRIKFDEALPLPARMG